MTPCLILLRVQFIDNCDELRLFWTPFWYYANCCSVGLGYHFSKCKQSRGESNGSPKGLQLPSVFERAVIKLNKCQQCLSFNIFGQKCYLTRKQLGMSSHISYYLKKFVTQSVSVWFFLLCAYFPSAQLEGVGPVTSVTSVIGEAQLLLC